MRLWREYVWFLRHEKRWWLVPPLVALALAVLFLVLTSSSEIGGTDYAIF